MNSRLKTRQFHQSMTADEFRQMRPRAKRKQPEHEEQVAFFHWANDMSVVYPILKLLFAIPNGGHRHKAVAMKLRAEGVRPGVPDLFLPAARKQYHGWFHEMKVSKNKPSPEQAIWHEALRAQGYYVSWGNGEQAKAECIKYLRS